MSTVFKNRVFGCVIVKSINSNYNADFTHQPRTLNDGTAYATDKVLKYSVRHFITKAYSDEKLFYFKSFSEAMQPRTLDETYTALFGPNDKKAKADDARKMTAKNLLSCIDVRLFGGTFASKNANLSIHGPVQITHGVNRFGESVIYSEQIMSPFRNSNEDKDDSMMTTLGSQSKLKEGHYVHHFSINPHNLDTLVALSDGTPLLSEDVDKLKAALCKGVTLYDSAAKAGTENELMLFVQLKEGSMLVLPSFVNLISIKNDADRTIDLSKVSQVLAQPSVSAHIEHIELYYDTTVTVIENVPTGAIVKPINA